MEPTLKTRRQLVTEFIRRILVYTSLLSWFGSNSVIRAIALAFSAWIEGTYQLYVGLVRRYTVRGGAGDTLTDVCAERGVDRIEKNLAKVYVVVQPLTANATAVSVGTGPIAGGDEIEVDDSSIFLVADSIRIRNGDGTVTETATIAGITVGTGPTGGDELEIVGALAGAYTPATDDVDVLLRTAIPAGALVNTSVGVPFNTLDSLTTGDSNPIMDGESTSLALADKVWCEAGTSGAAGNIDARTVTDFATTYRIAGAFNPERGSGGLDEEEDYELKYRTVHAPTIANQETLAWLESLLQAGDLDVLRVVKTSGTAIRTLYVKVIRRNGGTFSVAQLAALDLYAEARIRSNLQVSSSNVTLTAIEVEARITLEPGYTLEEVWRSAADTLATYLDYRRWAWGGTVDEADLLSLVNATTGVASLETSSFLPAADTTVAADSLPVLARLSLEDMDTGATYNAELAVSF